MKQDDKEVLRDEVRKQTKGLKWEFKAGAFQTEITVRYYPMNFHCILKSTGKEITAQVMGVYFAYLSRMCCVSPITEAETYSDDAGLEKVQEGLTERISAFVDEIEELGITNAILEYQQKVAYYYGRKSA